MFDKLFNIFIKDYKNVNDIKVRTAYGKFANISGIALNVLLFILKAVAGIISGSVAVIADAVNNLSDASSNAIGFIGFKLSERPADEKHPYGHGRYEYITGLTIAFIIATIGLELLKSGIEKIISPTVVNLTLISVIILSVSILIKLFMCAMYKVAGKKISSDALLASSADSRNDVLSTSAVLVSLIVSHYTNFVLDGYVGVVVALFILISGIKIVKDMITPLLGQAPEVEYVNEIKEKIMSYEGVLGVHDLIVHDYGPGRKLASVHVEMSSEEDVLKSHELIDGIERDFVTDMNLHLVIHYDPISTRDELITELKEYISNAVNNINDALSIHDVRIVRGVDRNIVLFDLVIPFGIKLDEVEIVKNLDNKVKEVYPTFDANVTIDKNYSGVK